MKTTERPNVRRPPPFAAAWQARRRPSETHREPEPMGRDIGFRASGVELKLCAAFWLVAFGIMRFCRRRLTKLNSELRFLGGCL